MNQQLPDIIFLCGFMGAGKSTIGQKLAGKLELPFQDLDRVIEERAGKTILQIFREEGEEYFRTAERAALTTTAREFNGVLALGGGALQNLQIAEQVKLYGLLIFIETPFSVILDRISAGKQRPLLLDKNGEMKKKKTLGKELSALYEQRLPIYRKADITLQSNRFDSPGEAAEELIKKIDYHDSQH